MALCVLPAFAVWRAVGGFAALIVNFKDKDDISLVTVEGDRLHVGPINVWLIGSVRKEIRWYNKSNHKCNTSDDQAVFACHWWNVHDVIVFCFMLTDMCLLSILNTETYKYLNSLDIKNTFVMLRALL